MQTPNTTTAADVIVDSNTTGYTQRTETGRPPLLADEPISYGGADNVFIFEL